MAYKTKIGIPSLRSGKDGDLSLHVVNNGIALYGKVRDTWYKFGHGNTVSSKGKQDLSKNGGNLLGNKLNLQDNFYIRQSRFEVKEEDNLSIYTKWWNMKSTTSSTFEIGNILFVPLYGSQSIGVEGASNNSGNHLNLYGGNTSAEDQNGGSLFINAGSAAGSGSGSHGRVIIGHSGSYELGVALDIWDHTQLKATKKLFFDGASTTTGFLDTTGNTYIYESGTDILDFYVGNVNLLKLTEAGGGASDKVAIPALTPLYFDGGADTYIAETGADLLDFYVGGVQIMSLIESTVDQAKFYTGIAIPATKRLVFDTTLPGTTYISESSDDVLDIVVGGDTIFQITESGADGNTINVDDACIGFTQKTPGWDVTNTYVDFRLSNKQFVTFGGGDITNLVLYFPLVSGNFVLLLKQDGVGSRTITNYKAMEFDESAADGSASVKWPGGLAEGGSGSSSGPNLTDDANHVDILSFYWDADNEIAYGVATLDFQF